MATQNEEIWPIGGYVARDTTDIGVGGPYGGQLLKAVQSKSAALFWNLPEVLEIANYCNDNYSATFRPKKFRLVEDRGG